MLTIISLTTDYGSADWFAGSMKGVIIATNPRAIVVDITHDIPAGDVRAGAFVLAAAYRSFLRNTVHLAVVDPGVGSSRAGIVVRTEDYFFVGPDNGVLSLALMQEKVQEIHKLESEIYFRKPVSPTFHGRDIFAPVAAKVTEGILLDSLGPKLKEYVRLELPKSKMVAGALLGEIVYVDHFGNAITNLDSSTLAYYGKRSGRIWLRNSDVCGMGKFYHDVAKGQSLGIIGSTGHLEVAVNGGNAAQALGLKVGDAVEAR